MNKTQLKERILKDFKQYTERLYEDEEAINEKLSKIIDQVVDEMAKELRMGKTPTETTATRNSEYSRGLVSGYNMSVEDLNSKLDQFIGDK